MNSFLRYNILSILWAIFILVLCLMPGRHLPRIPIYEFDKIVHFTFYFVLALMMYYGWKKQDLFLSLHHSMITKIIIITSSYGFIIEIMQELFTADRHFDIFDALANSIGAVAGSFLAIYIKPKLTNT